MRVKQEELTEYFKIKSKSITFRVDPVVYNKAKNCPVPIQEVAECALIKFLGITKEDYNIQIIDEGF
jgi:hypothetical protein